MNRELTAEELERYADGELNGSEAAVAEEHLQLCARCATAVLQILQMKQAIRDVADEEPAPALRASVRKQISKEIPAGKGLASWLSAAAAIALIISAIVVARRESSSDFLELTDLHTTQLASANPVDVVSTDRHTVKPWFEGRLPFTVPVPDLATTQFRLIGGRVIFWHGNPAAYLLIGKGAHRISLFVFRDDTAPHTVGRPPASVTTAVWRANGLTFVAVAQIPASDLAELRARFISQS